MIFYEDVIKAVKTLEESFNHWNFDRELIKQLFIPNKNRKELLDLIILISKPIKHIGKGFHIGGEVRFRVPLIEFKIK